jgi:glucuronokinase
VWCDNPGDSGAVHSTVRARWDAGDADTRALMAQVAALAPAGRAAIEARDAEALAALMDANFELRRGLFGDAALGRVNVGMVRTAQRCGAGAKFCGSGGAAVACCPGGAEQEARLQADCAAAGLRCERVRVHRPEPRGWKLAVLLLAAAQIAQRRSAC